MVEYQINFDSNRGSANQPIRFNVDFHAAYSALRYIRYLYLERLKAEMRRSSACE